MENSSDIGVLIVNLFIWLPVIACLLRMSWEIIKGDL